MKALCIALVNNVSVQTLDLSGNDLRLQGVRYVHDLMVENNYITELVGNIHTVLFFNFTVNELL